MFSYVRVSIVVQVNRVFRKPDGQIPPRSASLVNPLTKLHVALWIAPALRPVPIPICSGVHVESAMRRMFVVYDLAEPGPDVAHVTFFQSSVRECERADHFDRFIFNAQIDERICLIFWIARPTRAYHVARLDVISVQFFDEQFKVLRMVNHVTISKHEPLGLAFLNLKIAHASAPLKGREVQKLGTPEAKTAFEQ